MQPKSMLEWLRGGVELGSGGLQRLVAWGELGGVDPCVGREGVCDVLLPVGNWALAGHNRLHKHQFFEYPGTLCILQYPRVT